MLPISCRKDSIHEHVHMKSGHQAALFTCPPLLRTLFFWREDPVADRQADLVGVPLRRSVERVGMRRLHGTVGVHVDLSAKAVSVVMAVHPGPAKECVEQPPVAELVLVTHAQADHHAVTLRIAVFQLDLPFLDKGFRHVECHHADIRT